MDNYCMRASSLWLFPRIWPPAFPGGIGPPAFLERPLLIFTGWKHRGPGSAAFLLWKGHESKLSVAFSQDLASGIPCGIWPPAFLERPLLIFTGWSWGPHDYEW